MTVTAETPPPEAAQEARGTSGRPWVRRRPAQVVAESVGVLLTAVAVAGLTVYAGRRELAEDIARRWMREQGLAGALSVERLDADGFSGSLRVGPERDPDLAVERIEVDLALEPAWAVEPFKLSTRAVRLVRPRLKVRLDDRGLTYGRLDPAVRALLARPDTGEPGPLVLVEDGSVRLYTPYGPLRLRGSGAVDDGRLARLEARVRPARLEGEALAADLGEGVVRLAGRGDRLTGRFAVPVFEWSGGGIDMTDGEAVLELDAPYPEGRDLTLRGPLLAELTLAAKRLASGAATASAGRLRLAFEGTARGALDKVRLSGTLAGAGSAREVAGADLQAADVSVRAERVALELSRTGARAAGLRLSGTLTADARELRMEDGRLGRVKAALSTARGAVTVGPDGMDTAGPARLVVNAEDYVSASARVNGLRAEARADLGLLTGAGSHLALAAAADRASISPDGRRVSLANIRMRLAGPADWREGPVWRADGGASARGALAPADAAPVADRIPVLGGADSHRDAIVAALAGFDLRAERLAVSVADGVVAIDLLAPARLDAASGAEVAVASIAGSSVWRTDATGAGGDAVFTARGGGLPTLTVSLQDWSLDGGRYAADTTFAAEALDAAIVRGATLAGRGRATLDGDGFSFAATGCFPVRSREVEFGENDLADAAGEICPPATGPLITADADGYRVRGRFQRAGLAWPVAEAQGARASGAFDIRGDDDGLTGGEVRLAAATVADTAAEVRYTPVGVSGGIDLRGGVWRGRFGVSRERYRVAAVDVVHRDGDGVGSAVIDGRALAFDPAGLQPEDLSPLVAGLVADAKGTLDFTGRVDWTPAGSTSRGRLTTAGFDFRSPAGGVNQIVADVAFTSLTPLLSAPEQSVSIRRVDAVAEITDAETRVTLGPDTVTFSATRFAVAGGAVGIDRFSIPLDGSGRYSGVVVLEGVQLGQVMDALNLGELIAIDAAVDGRVPFEVAPGVVRFADGRLSARRPGRIEISRAALTGVTAAAGAAGAAAPVNAVQDFAYQAMENLAFDRLELEVNSLPEGRLGLLFMIAGRHDPEVAEEARVGWLEALRGTAFQRRIPLPKGTPVNLTLDTTLNFDELLTAWLEIARRRTGEAQAEAARSAPVQAAAPKTAP